MKLSANKKTISAVVIGILFILSLNFFQKEARGFFYSISAPIQKKLWNNGSEASGLWGAIFRAPGLSEENENLKLKIQELLSDQNYLKELEKENQMLREALNLGLSDKFKLELAEIIGKDVNRENILIDKGLEDGISNGLFVINSQKVMIGTISEVYKNYSKVLLISDKQSSFEARLPSVNSSGLAKGLGGRRIVLDLIPKDDQIVAGDLVVSGDLMVGLIKEVIREDASPFQQAEISPFFDILKENKVFIVLQ